MDTYLYCAKTNAFYPLHLQQQYGADWPSDGVLVSDEVFIEFVNNQPPTGKHRIAGKDGLPCWADIPPPTQEEIAALANSEKSRRLAEAKEKIELLSDAVELDLATEKEISQLNEWKKYRVLVSRIDASLAPNIEWPARPNA